MPDNIGKKIVVISPSAPPFGGGGVVAAHYHLFRVILSRGFDTRLITFADDNTDTSEKNIIRCGTGSRMRKWILFVLYFHLKLNGSRKLAYQLADIWCSSIGAMRADKHIGGFSPDVVILPDHGGAGLYIKKRSAKICLVAHHNPSRFCANPLLGDFCPLDARMAVSLEQRALKKVDSVICPSGYMKESLQSTYSFAGPIAVIPNVMDRTLVDPIEADNLHVRLGLQHDAPIVYIPSAGSSFKGAGFVFEIIRRLAAASNTEIGFYLSGPIEGALSETLRYIPQNARLFIPGHVGYMENISYVKGCSFAVSPTLIENFGMSLLESAFCDLPAVVFDTGGNRELVMDGESGFIVPYLDVESLIARGVALLDRGVLDTMKAKTRSAVRTKFDSDRIAGDILKFVGAYE